MIAGMIATLAIAALTSISFSTAAFAQGGGGGSSVCPKGTAGTGNPHDGAESSGNPHDACRGS